MGHQLLITMLNSILINARIMCITCCTDDADGCMMDVAWLLNDMMHVWCMIQYIDVAWYAACMVNDTVHAWSMIWWYDTMHTWFMIQCADDAWYDARMVYDMLVYARVLTPVTHACGLCTTIWKLTWSYWQFNFWCKAHIINVIFIFSRIDILDIGLGWNYSE